MDSSLLTKLKQHTADQHPTAKHNHQKDMLESTVILDGHPNLALAITINFDNQNHINFLFSASVLDGDSADSWNIDEIENNLDFSSSQLFEKYTFNEDQTRQCINNIKTLLPELLTVVAEHDKDYKVRFLDFRGIGTDQEGDRKDLKDFLNSSQFLN